MLASADYIWLHDTCIICLHWVQIKIKAENMKTPDKNGEQ